MPQNTKNSMTKLTFPFPDSFFNEEAIRLLTTLNPNQQPLWGIMTPQHIVEHVVGSWIISNGRFAVEQKTTEEQKEKRLKFLFSPLPFEKGISNPVTGNKLNPLKKESLEKAIEAYTEAINTFYEFHEKNPNAKPVHPAFGPLDKKGWLQFQSKHMGHHFTQFGLLA